MLALAASQFSIAAYPWLFVLLWSLICTYGLLRYFSRWLVTIPAETFCCYCKQSKSVLYKLTMQYFYTRGTWLTYITQELCQFGDRVCLWNSRPSFSHPPAYGVQINHGWRISYVEAICMQPTLTTSNDHMWLYFLKLLGFLLEDILQVNATHLRWWILNLGWRFQTTNKGLYKSESYIDLIIIPICFWLHFKFML